MFVAVAGGDIWPLAGAKPGIKSIWVAAVGLPFADDFWLVDTGVKNPICWVVDVLEGRDRNAPRDLAANVPVFEVLQVVDKNLLLVGWMEFDLAGLESFDGLLGEWFHIDEPLLFQERLDDGVALVTVANFVHDILLAAAKAEIFEIFEDGFAAFCGGHTLIFAGIFVHFAVEADNGNHIKVMAFANFVVVLVVSRGNFDGAGAILHVGVFVCDEFDGAVC